MHVHAQRVHIHKQTHTHTPKEESCGPLTGQLRKRPETSCLGNWESMLA